MNSSKPESENLKQAVPGETNGGQHAVHRIVIHALGAQPKPETPFDKLIKDLDGLLKRHARVLPMVDLQLLSTVRRELTSRQHYDALQADFVATMADFVATMDQLRQSEQNFVELRERFRIEIDNHRANLEALKKDHDAHVKRVEENLSHEINKDVQASEAEQKVVDSLKRSNRMLRSIVKRLKVRLGE